jgi:hypothetical protein
VGFSDVLDPRAFGLKFRASMCLKVIDESPERMQQKKSLCLCCISNIFMRKLLQMFSLVHICKVQISAVAAGDNVKELH